MKTYPIQFITLIDNMIKFHFGYEDMFEQVKVSFPDIQITYDELLEVIEQRIITMI